MGVNQDSRDGGPPPELSNARFPQAAAFGEKGYVTQELVIFEKQIRITFWLIFRQIFVTTKTLKKVCSKTNMFVLYSP